MRTRAALVVGVDRRVPGGTVGYGAACRTGRRAGHPDPACDDPRSGRGRRLHLPDGSGRQVVQRRRLPPLRHEPRGRPARPGGVSSRHPRAAGVSRAPAASGPPVLRARSLEGPSRHDLQRRPRKVLSRVRRQRGSAVLRTRASTARRGRDVPVPDHVSEDRDVPRAERLLSDRRHAAAHDGNGLRAGAVAGSRCGWSATTRQRPTATCMCRC